MKFGNLALGAGLAVWTGAQIVRAHTELAKRPVVQGLHREWAPPVEDGPYGGYVVDPRPGSLEAELRARYGFDSLPPRPPDALGPGDGSAPRLVWAAPEAPLLVVGRYGGDLVVFVPDTGVVLLPPGALAADLPARTLDVPRESPF